MKRKMLAFIMSICFVMLALTIPVSANTGDSNLSFNSNINDDTKDVLEYEFSFVHDIAGDNEDVSRGTHGSCTHYGTIEFVNITSSSDIQSKYRAKVSHYKASINNCTEMMDWKIQFVIFVESNGVIIHPPRERIGTLAIGLSNYEVFSGIPGHIFEWQLVTTVAGVTDKTGYKRIQF